MFTTKASGYFALATILLVLGLLLQDWQLVALVLPVASLFFLSNVWGLPERVKVRLSHQVIPSDSFGDEDIRVRIEISNETNGNLSNVEVHELVPDTIKIEKGAARIRAQLKLLEKLEVQLGFPSPIRGHYPVGPVVVRARDPFELYLVEAKAESEVLSIMPRPERIRGAELRPRHLGPWPGIIPARTLGSGTEFYSMRGYVAGDDLKRINWKASARHRRLITNETEAERVTDVMIVLDTDVTFYESAEAELFERGVRAAASLASLLLRQGNRVGMILQGEERGIAAPAFGKRHERNILYLLAAAKPGRAVIPTDYAVALLAKLLLPARAQIVIITSLMDNTIVAGIRGLVTAGYSVLVLSPSPGVPVRFESESEELAYRMLMLERANTLFSLEKICSVSQWPVGIPLSVVLSKVRRLRPMIRV
ncbi:DUF58 domain-containing protein [Candidatus Bathyarchaeota archaeon]|nr:MAG: DUF58 domain-containing protein [Candidatus Bathyarchaeota archaeon]